MRRTILLSLFALLAVGVACDASAQRRGGAGFGFGRGGDGFAHGRARSPYGLGYGYLPYGSDYAYSPYDFGDAYPYPPQPDAFAQQPPFFVPPPAPPVVQTPVHPVVTEYKWPAAGSGSSSSASSAISESEPQAFAIVLKNGSTLSALMVFASDDGTHLHYVDPDERHLGIAMSEVDRTATLKLNRSRNLNLHLPAAQ